VGLVAAAPYLWLTVNSRPRRGALLGLVFGFAYYGAVLYWILLFGKLAWFVTVGALAIYQTVFGLLAPTLWRRLHPIASAAGIAGLWVVIEFARSQWPVGGFTWAQLAYTQAGNPLIIRLASITGVWGISFLVAFVNLLIVIVVSRWGSGRRLGAVVAVGAAVVLIAAPGLIPIAASTGPEISIATVQIGLPPASMDPYARVLDIARRQATLYDTLATKPPDLGVWAEDALDLDPNIYLDVASIVEGSVTRVGAPTLVGVISGEPGKVQRNSSYLYDPSGNVIATYSKTHLVPFGEYVPGRSFLGWIPQIHEVPRDLTPGQSVHTLPLGNLSFGNVICFENGFPSIDRTLVNEGANFLVTTTNDASYRYTAESEQQLEMDRFRAVENARWVVHAAITGRSAIIAPDGRVVVQTGLFEPQVMRGTIVASSARTLYDKVGDRVVWLAVFAALGAFLMPRWKKEPTRAPDRLPRGARALVILPTYNESATIASVVGAVLENTHADVMVVDDSSPDGTADIVRGIADSNPRVRLRERPAKSGLASAYTDGFEVAIREGYDLAVEMDSDLSHDPTELPGLLAGAERHDLTIGSRYVPGGSVSNWSRSRVALSRAGNSYARLCLGLPVHDATSGYRVYRRDLLETLMRDGVHAEGYGFQIELADRAWRFGWDVGESPITFREREHGQSKISRRIVVEALWMVTVWGFRRRIGQP
jgi:apolipoprotein N-acyltransferase